MKKIAIIGCGARSRCYLLYIKEGLNKEYQVIALADPNPRARDYYQEEFGTEATRQFDTGPELMEALGDKLDAVVIGSPNGTHMESALPTFRRGLVAAMEKPVEVTIERCAEMLKVWRESGQPPTALGFVLRYTAFYGTIKKLLDAGEIGRVLSMEASEMLGAPLSGFFFRNWRKDGKMSGPFLLEKCSHDLDLLIWLAGARAQRVSSFANRSRFVPNPKAAEKCSLCSLREDCRYDNRRHEPGPGDPLSYFWDVLNDAHREDCVFNTPKDICDNQVVNIEFENGVLANFTVSMDQPRTTRRIKINGTNGQIVGDIGKDDLRVVHDAVTESYAMGTFDWERTYPMVYEHSGHHGGDSVLSRQFNAMLKGEPTPPLAGLPEGVEASILALAAQESADTGTIVDLKPIYAKVFGEEA